MKVIFLTGSHPRHTYFANKIFQSGFLSGLIIEKRGAHTPIPPENLNQHDKDLFNLHFKKRAEAEDRFFKVKALPQVPTLNTSLEELNSKKTISFIKEISPDLIISYGVHKLTNEVINTCKGDAWNIHGGLSPWYRGNTTHFWPSYMLEPQMTGMTVHQLTQDIDAGDVIHQNVGELVKGDGIHDLACRTVQGLAEELPLILKKYANTNSVIKHKHNTTGKIWIGTDWKPQQLSLIYDYYNDSIVDKYLNGEFQKREPKVFRENMP